MFVVVVVGGGVVCLFFPLDFFTVQALPQAFMKLSDTPVPAHPWTVHC